MYEKELEAIKKSGRLRKRRLFASEFIDMASNDYLGLAHYSELAQRAFARLQQSEAKAPKASALVNGYHPLHAELETALAEANGFEAGIVLGSGFLANMSLIEALLRKGDHLFMDELYHASGVLATRLFPSQVTFFKHNDMEQLDALLKASTANRNLIAVEGVYSMEGDRVPKAVFNVVARHEALLILDEAHSSGVIGANLLGIMDAYGVPPSNNIIKMGTLGKAYGSYGAYILASETVIAFLENRAKPIIYSTALSLYDTAIAIEAFEHINAHKTALSQAVKTRQEVVKELLGVDIGGLIIPIEVSSNAQALHWQQQLMEQGYLVGAIRQPTVPKPILRIIARLNVSVESLKKVIHSGLEGKS